MGSIPEVTLSLGGKGMPVIGLGTVSPTRNDHQGVKTAVLAAIELGYRHFDTASSYGSEKPLGEAVAEAIDLGLIESRDELFITSKLPYESVAQDLVLPALQMSLRNLQMDYLDLHLIHWPLRLKPGVTQFPVKKDDILPFDMKSVWQAMEETHKLGLARAIGVSNFSIKLLNELLDNAVIPPAVNQVEMNPAWQQVKMLEFCKGKGIHVTGYSPLGANGTRWGDNRIVENPVLKEIGKPRGKSAAQVSLRWIHEQGASTVVKSFNKERMKTNLQIFDWKLTEEDLKKISQLPQRKGVIPSLMLNEEFKDFDNET